MREYLDEVKRSNLNVNGAVPWAWVLNWIKKKKVS